MANLNQFLNQGMSADDVAHSSGYASIAGGGGAGGLSMEQRRKLLNQPRIVGAYQHSRLGRQGSSVKARTADQHRARTYDVSTGEFADGSPSGNRQRGGLKEAQVDKTVERRRFVEPPARNYNKYS